MIPSFKYHPNPLSTGAFIKGNPCLCSCCKEITEVWYESPFYSSSYVDCLCPECIANGQAAQKFDGEFLDAENTDEISDPSKLDELIHRTPGYQSWQDTYWPAHCDDYCAFIAYVGWDELVELNIDQEIENNYASGIDGFTLTELKQYMKNNGSVQGYLFKCLHCGQYVLHIDYD